jgi:hypothetical protein
VRARRTLRGIDEQVAKAQRAVDGKAAVKCNRFVKLTGLTKSVNRDLEAKTRALAGWLGYTTNLTGQTPEFVIDAHLTVVFAALAVTHRIEHQTGWSMKQFVRTARRYRTIHVGAGQQILTAADPYPRTSTKPSPRSTHQTVCTDTKIW